MLRTLGVLLFALSAQATTLDFTILGDAGEWNPVTQSVRDSHIRLGVFDMILPGDNLYSGDYATQWAPWTQKGFRYEIVALGNHHAGYENEMKFFWMPGEYYSKAYPGLARFIVLNSDNVRNVDEQMRFLDAEFRTATEPFIYLVYHHPTYTLSRFHNWREKAVFQTRLRQMMWANRSKITALIVGHDHLALLAHFNDLPVIVSGAAHETRADSPRNDTQEGVRVRTSWYFDDNPTWVRLQMDSKSSAATARFIRARDDREMCTATIVTGHAAALADNCAKTTYKEKLTSKSF